MDYSNKKPRVFNLKRVSIQKPTFARRSFLARPEISIMEISRVLLRLQHRRLGLSAQIESLMDCIPRYWVCNSMYKV